MPLERTRANGRERLHQVDKLGVTGSSPVPPIEITCNGARVVARVGMSCIMWQGLTLPLRSREGSDDFGHEFSSCVPDLTLRRRPGDLQLVVLGLTCCTLVSRSSKRYAPEALVEPWTSWVRSTRKRFPRVAIVRHLACLRALVRRRSRFFAIVRRMTRIWPRVDHRGTNSGMLASAASASSSTFINSCRSAGAVTSGHRSTSSIAQAAQDAAVLVESQIRR